QPPPRRQRPTLAQENLSSHAFEAGALDAACRGAAKIVIDHFDLRPTECGQPIAHGILQRAALAVVQNLMSRRLPDVENRFALQVMSANLVSDHRRLLSASR